MRKRKMRIKSKLFKIIVALILIYLIILVGSSLIGLDKWFNTFEDNNAEGPSFSERSNSLATEPKEYKKDPTIDYLNEGGALELPVNGASGYASVPLPMYVGASLKADLIRTLEAGSAFTITEEVDEWWKIETDSGIGWVEHKYCFINLPDVVPSIVYNNTNSNASKIMSSGKNIPNVTGSQLYEAYSYNKRLDRGEFVIPVLYAMAPKICSAQQAAIKDGNTLIIYEGFRPFETQRKIVENLSKLIKSDVEVKEGISDELWSIGWFISTKISNHQKGCAIDVSIGKITKEKVMLSGSYSYKQIIGYSEFTMFSPIHELSIASKIFKFPVSSKSETLWRNAVWSDNVNDEAKLLQQYCTEAGLTPLASEWWHFNDLSCTNLSEDTQSDGKYFIQKNRSRVPNFDLIIQ